METTTSKPERNLLTVRQFAAKHPAFTEASLRFIIFKAGSNGFKNCIRRIGRKVLLDEAAFFECVDQRNAQSKGAAREQSVA